jgi:uncharacterized protein (TIGR03435 family)
MFLRVFQLMALAILPVSALFAQDLTGTWQGVVKNPDTKEELRTVLKIASSDGNPIKANFYSIDQTYLVFPATLTLQGPVIKMNIPGIAATWEGKLATDSTTLTGTLKGFSVPVTWTMKRVGADQAWNIPKPPAPPKMASPDPVFEVATIKPSNPDLRTRDTRVQGGNTSITNFTLTELLTLAFEVHSHQIIGAPAWSTSQRYDITAKAEGAGQPNQDQLKIMLRKLLADRFQLVFHKEQRELPVYTLTVAKGGAKISINDGKAETTGIIFRGPGSVLFNSVTMDDLSKLLQNSAVDRPVVNQTGLSGKYEFSLVWTPEQMVAPAGNPNALTTSGRGDVPPDLFAAVQQQLGLKLDSTRLRIEVLVVDKVEKASEN